MSILAFLTSDPRTSEAAKLHPHAHFEQQRKGSGVTLTSVRALSRRILHAILWKIGNCFDQWTMRKCR